MVLMGDEKALQGKQPLWQRLGHESFHFPKMQCCFNYKSALSEDIFAILVIPDRIHINHASGSYLHNCILKFSLTDFMHQKTNIL